MMIMEPNMHIYLYLATMYDYNYSVRKEMYDPPGKVLNILKGVSLFLVTFVQLGSSFKP